MREISVPPWLTSRRNPTSPTWCCARRPRPRNPALFSRLDAAGAWQDVRATDFLADVSALAKGLMASGVAAGRPGRHHVPHPLRMGAHRLRHLVRRRRLRADLRNLLPLAGGLEPRRLRRRGRVRRSPPHHEDIIRQAADSEGLTALEHVWQLEGSRPGRGRAPPAAACQRRRPGRTPQRGRPRRRRHHHLHLRHHRPAQGLRADARQLRGTLRERAGHVAGRRRPRAAPRPSCSCRWPTSSPASSPCWRSPPASRWRTPRTSRTCCRICRATSPRSSWPCRASSRRSTTRRLTKAEDGGKGAIFHRAADTAIAYSRARQAGKVAPGLKLKHALFDKLVYGKLRDAMGGRSAHAVSGGGPLGERLGHFFQGIGLQILEGYGLTETTAPITVNTPAADQDRHGRRPASRQRRQDCRRRRNPRQGRVRHARLLQARRPDRRGLQRRLVPHRRHRRAGRATAS